ncbi:uncharacterized protein LOC143909293 [Arctopsyche grandis]|uniref:uncharacterized protein LOC143909293 n=1 Tax=Arctopsyche grandis TaxID=121162 RepID=UPI00406D82EC
MECRLCLSTSAPVAIFIETEGLAERIWTCCHLQVERDDGLPDKICFECESKLDSYTQFRDTCEQTDRILRQRFINDLNIKKEENHEYANCYEESISDIINQDKYSTKDNTQSAPFNTPWSKPTDEPNQVYNDNMYIKRETECLESNGLIFPIKKHKCITCGKALSSKKSLKRHALIHLRSKVRKCKICLKLYATRDDTPHDCERIKIEYEKDPDDYAETLNTDDVQIKRDVDEDSDDSKFVIAKTHPARKRSACGTCGKMVTTKHLKRHTSTHSKARKFKCGVCKDTITDKDQHKLLHLNDKNFKCDVCDKWFFYKHQLNAHQRSHVGMKKFSCDMCGRKCESASKVRKHIRAVHLKIKTHQCSACGKLLTDQQSYKDHMKIHSDYCPYICDYCSRGFKHRNSIIGHIRTHTGEKPYKCEICARAFISTGILKSHILQHTGENPFKCELCFKGFKQRCNLKSHMRHFHKKF